MEACPGASLTLSSCMLYELFRLMVSSKDLNCNHKVAYSAQEWRPWIAPVFHKDWWP